MREELPIACTLESRELADREQNWRTLVERTSTVRTVIPGGVRVSFRPDPGVEETLRRLIRQEAECCSWMKMNLSGGDPIQLEVTAPRDGVPVVQQMFDVRPVR